MASLHLEAALGTPGLMPIAAFGGLITVQILDRFQNRRELVLVKQSGGRCELWALEAPPPLSSVPSEDHLTFLSLFSHCKVEISNNTL